MTLTTAHLLTLPLEKRSYVDWTTNNNFPILQGYISDLNSFFCLEIIYLKMLMMFRIIAGWGWKVEFEYVEYITKKSMLHFITGKLIILRK
jgi:hypothetical protein